MLFKKSAPYRYFSSIVICRCHVPSSNLLLLEKAVLTSRTRSEYHKSTRKQIACQEIKMHVGVSLRLYVSLKV